MRARTFITTLPAALLAAAALGGCGSSSSSSSTTSSTTTTARTTPASGAHKLAGSATGAKAGLSSLDRLPRGRRQVVQAHFTGLSGLALPDKLSTLAGNVASFWAMEFRGSQLQLPPATLNVIDATPVACGATQLTTTDPPLYCVPTQSLDLTVGYIQNNVAPIGDAALALLVSDIYGYHVENVLGAFSQSARLSPVQLAEMDSCFSGTYFYYLQAVHALGPGDEAAVNKLLTQIAPVSSSQGSAASVTSDQLTTAFNVGIESQGNASVCLPKRTSSGGTTTTP